MKNLSLTTVLKIALLLVVGGAFLLLLGAYLIPGILLWWIFGERYKGWIGTATALVVVVGLRSFSGQWPASIGEFGSSGWYVELTSLVLSWAVGSILVSVGYDIPRYFLEGLMSANASKIG